MYSEETDIAAGREIKAPHLYDEAGRQVPAFWMLEHNRAVAGMDIVGRKVSIVAFQTHRRESVTRQDFSLRRMRKHLEMSEILSECVDITKC